MMNNEGFPKSPLFHTLTGVETDIHEPCLFHTTHEFVDLVPMQKMDEREGKVEIVVFNRFYCKYCLLHASSEVQRVTPRSEASPFDELEKMMAAGNGKAQ